MGSLQSDLRASGADVKWIDPANLHLTLKFLGNIDEAQVQPLKEALASLTSPLTPFTCIFEGIGARRSLIKRHGAVSPQVAKAMAIGVRKWTRAKLGLSLTGIAGPTGGTKRKPVGLVYIGLSSPQGTRTVQLRFPGTRSIVKFRASQAALNLLRLYLITGRFV